MTNSLATIKDILHSDPILRDMLPNGKSIYAAGQLNGDSKMPAIQLTEGAKVAREEFTVLEEYYIRVYDDPSNASIFINKIHDRIFELLHRANFYPDRGVAVQCKFRSSLPLYPDDAYGKNYIEAVYRVAAL